MGKPLDTFPEAPALEGPRLGVIRSCGACGGRIQRVADHAPFGQADWRHLNVRVCPGAAA